ncbi:cell division protein ZapA [Feifania hominis]|uniref:Cell division protein ZapA n=1 Tax=Feifania hominis TaxID=2763660 RepID=A0A926DFX7_9FIRM|nr:cell division protein ZapA [Feifania hominis]MBC8537131.1 cell division protein ZapA [Feifania hominis]
MKNRVTIKIMDTSFSLLTEESEEYVDRLAKAVDKEIRRTLEGNEKISVNMAAMLSALNFCDECTKATDAADNLRSQLKVYLEDIAKLKSANDDSRREIAKLYSEIQSLKLQLARNGNA